tara:strand:- start:4 stop:291 length:288 start_codon:yes stop_codon:yes gene_type:complete
MTSQESEDKKINYKSNQKKINLFRKQISSMSYEKSLEELNDILNKLQKETIPIDDIYDYYIKGNILLERCESLLNNLEQQVIEINPDNLLDSSNN